MKLKNCPFCGRKRLKIIEQKKSGHFYVGCITDDCPMNVCIDYPWRILTKQQAIKIWNRRDK